MLHSLQPLRFLTALIAAAGLCLSVDANANGCNNNVNLQCDAGGPYVAPCKNGTISIQLDGSGSKNATSYLWKSSCPGAVFSNATVQNPVLSFVGGSVCGDSCSITLIVKNGNQSKSCCTFVKLKDTTPPVITCPETIKIICGGDISPDAAGVPTVTDDCDAHPKLTYKDKIVWPECQAERFDHQVVRTWKAVDDACNVSKCTQYIDVLKVQTSLDILPGVCPNTFIANDCSLLPISVLGSSIFDVTRIKPESVRLYGFHCEGGPVKPKSWCFGDVATPFYGAGVCECHDLNGDGQLDLTFYFKRSQIADALGLQDVLPGTNVQLVVVGKLECDGCKFIAEDCLYVP